MNEITLVNGYNLSENYVLDWGLETTQTDADQELHAPYHSNSSLTFRHGERKGKGREGEGVTM